MSVVVVAASLPDFPNYGAGRGQEHVHINCMLQKLISKCLKVSCFRTVAVEDRVAEIPILTATSDGAPGQAVVVAGTRVANSGGPRPWVKVAAMWTL